MTVDQDTLKEWIGRTETAEDQVTAAPLAGMAATLDHEPPVLKPGDAAPAGAHWMYFHARVPQSQLDSRGHPSSDDFMPPAPLPRRMWGGGRLSFHQPLRVDERIERVSTIKNITAKQGRSGALVFVLVHHAVTGEDGLAVEEEHDIVYREAAKPNAPPPKPQPAPSDAAWSQTVEPDPTQLFRFSALTFNAARIHYDRRFVMEVEKYPGLIVNARLVGMMLIEQSQARFAGRPMTGFDFRFGRPLFDTGPFTIAGTPGDDGDSATLWAADEEGNLSLNAEARFG